MHIVILPVCAESLRFFCKKSEVSDIRDKWRERRLELIKVH